MLAVLVTVMLAACAIAVGMRYRNRPVKAERETERAEQGTDQPPGIVVQTVTAGAGPQTMATLAAAP